MLPARGLAAVGLALALGACAATGGAGFRATTIDPAPLWDYGDPAASGARFRAASEAAGGRATLMWQTQEARALGLASEFEAARALLAAVADGMGESPDEVHVRHALELGRVENSSGDPPAALPHFARAWRQARELGLDGLAVDAAHMLALASEPDDDLRWNGIALELAESSADPSARRWLASLLNNQGWMLHDREEFESALTVFERAVTEREGLDDPRRLRIAHWCVARCLRSLERFDEALAIQERLAAELEAAGETDEYVDEELAELRRALD